VNQTNFFYNNTSFFSGSFGEINEFEPESSITISLNCSSEEWFNSIKEKRASKGANLLPIDILSNGRIVDFTVDETIDPFQHEFSSATICIFQKTDESPYTDGIRQNHQKS